MIGEIRDNILEILKENFGQFIKGEITSEENIEFLKEVSLDIAKLKFQLLIAETEEERQIKKESIEAFYDTIELKIMDKKIKLRSETQDTAIAVLKAIISTITKMTLKTIGIG